ncbi:hypothetical protein [Acinetobacter baumannii]|jgi:hypothetical protein|uniref:hypothetical protein n=1 Tax=Acinetobacter baumannii TaxID=470 RepID=UPI003AF67F91
MKKILLAVLCATSISAYALTDDEKNNIGKRVNITCTDLAGYSIEVTNVRQKNKVSKDAFLKEVSRKYSKMYDFEFRKGMIEYIFSQQINKTEEDQKEISAKNYEKIYFTCMQTLLEQEGVYK